MNSSTSSLRGSSKVSQIATSFMPRCPCLCGKISTFTDTHYANANRSFAFAFTLRSFSTDWLMQSSPLFAHQLQRTYSPRGFVGESRPSDRATESYGDQGRCRQHRRDCGIPERTLDSELGHEVASEHR